MYERRVKERINTEIMVGVENRRNEKEFLVAMIKQLEQPLRLELRKKTILKAQCDQAYLRGVSAISMEALKMSQSTLKDYYTGMKMTTFDGSNIYSQIRKMNEDPVGTASALAARQLDAQAPPVIARGNSGNPYYGGFNQSFGK